MPLVKSSRNQDQLLLDGYVYRRATTSSSIWRCGRNDCPGRVRPGPGPGETQYVLTTHHIHARNSEQTIANEFKSKIVHHAMISHDAPRRIIHEVLLSVDENDGTDVPNYSSSQRNIQRKRKNNDIALPSPSSFGDIQIPDELKVTNGGARFLLYDNEKNNHRMIILSSDDDLDRLSNSDHSHCDGTFKV